MDLADFTIQAQQHDRIKPLLEDIARQAQTEAQFETAKMFDFGAQVSTAALSLASMAVYLWMRHYSDDKQTDIAKRRLGLISDLVKEGATLEQATATVTGLFDQLAKTGTVERALEAIRSLPGLGGGPKR